MGIYWCVTDQQTSFTYAVSSTATCGGLHLGQSLGGLWLWLSRGKKWHVRGFEDLCLYYLASADQKLKPEKDTNQTWKKPICLHLGGIFEAQNVSPAYKKQSYITDFERDGNGGRILGVQQFIQYKADYSKQ